MMTKEEMCIAVVREQLGWNYDKELKGFNEEAITDLCIQSTTMGIALEKLGYLNDEKYDSIREYLSNRGGIFKIFTKAVEGKDPVTHCLTFRELLDLLPDTLEGE